MIQLNTEYLLRIYKNLPYQQEQIYNRMLFNILLTFWIEFKFS